MVKKKELTEEKLRKIKADNAVVYNVLICLLLMGSILMLLQALKDYYGTNGGFTALYPRTFLIAGIGAGVFVLSLAGAAFWKNPIARTCLFWLSVIGVVTAATGVVMRVTWVDGFSLLYYLVCVIALQYIVFQLYRWEFFLFSLPTAAAGLMFLSFRQYFAWTPWNLGVLALALVILVGTAVVTLLASRRKGMLIFGKVRLSLFSAKSHPVLIYLAAALWLICIIATLLLGSLFAYYCLFAALAVELIAAVYYTFQLN